MRNLARCVLAAAVVLFCANSFAQAKKDYTVSEKDAKPGTPEWVAIQTVKAGLAKSLDDYLKLVCDDMKEKKRQVDHIRKYSWKQFSKRPDWYVVKKDPLTIKVAHIKEKIGAIRIYVHRVKAPGPTMPPPLKLRKQKDGTHCITSLSL